MGESPLDESDPACSNVVQGVAERTRKWLSFNGTRTVDWFHRELGKLVWNFIGMERDKNGLEKALSEIPSLREEFEKDVRVLGSADNLNTSLEKVGRVADFFELAELKARDALERAESCGGHFRSESQTPEGEALRDDDNFSHVAAWEWGGTSGSAIRHKEELEFEYVPLTQRSYK